MSLLEAAWIFRWHLALLLTVTALAMYGDRRHQNPAR